MCPSEIKSGRPRRYDITPVSGYASQEAAMAAAALDELRARLFDLVVDLPQPTMDFVPEGATNTIAMLVIHMAWAEASWIARVTGAEIPGDLELKLLPGRQGASGDLPPYSECAEVLITLCKRVRDEVTKPALASLRDLEREVADAQRPMTARGVLMHLIWHWTYHSGQVGLLRRLWGTRYQWTFGSLGGS